jgi:hypothetical protein
MAISIENAFILRMKIMKEKATENKSMEASTRVRKMKISSEAMVGMGLIPNLPLLREITSSKGVPAERELSRPNPKEGNSTKET